MKTLIELRGGANRRHGVTDLQSLGSEDNVGERGRKRTVQSIAG
jgi:hypothetical protein